MKHKINTKNNNTKKTIENDENFLDGGFGWIVCVAAGIANVSYMQYYFDSLYCFL